MEYIWQLLGVVAENKVVAALGLLATLSGTSAAGLAGTCWKLARDNRRGRGRNATLAAQNEKFAREIAAMAKTIAEQESEIEVEGEFSRRLSHAFPKSTEDRHVLMHAMDRLVGTMDYVDTDGNREPVREFLVSCAEVLAWDCRREPKFLRCSTEALATNLLSRILMTEEESLGAAKLEFDPIAAARDLESIELFDKQFASEPGIVDRVVAAAFSLARDAVPLEPQQRAELSEWASLRFIEVTGSTAELLNRDPAWIERYPNTFGVWFIASSKDLAMTDPMFWFFGPEIVTRAAANPKMHAMIRNAVTRELDAIIASQGSSKMIALATPTSPYGSNWVGPYQLMQKNGAWA